MFGCGGNRETVKPPNGGKTAIIGYSGSGKSTLAKYLGKKYQIPVLHLDQVHWLPGWRERERLESAEIVGRFLDENESWIIDGNYSAMEYERRMAEADQIIFLKFNRFACLSRAFRRYFCNRGRTRKSMTEGCPEKMDLEFIWWILHEGRTGRQKKKYRTVQEKYGKKLTVIRNQRELDFMIKRYGIIERENYNLPKSKNSG